MVKNLTGREFTPQEFRALNECVNCGRAENIDYGAVCDKCKADNLNTCDRCEHLIRNGEFEFFMYDDRPDQPWNTKVREFSYFQTFDNAACEGGKCGDCVWWEDRMQDRCWDCKTEFKNTRENFKKEGNLCERCAPKYNNEN